MGYHYISLGDIERERGNSEKALGYYEKALQVDRERAAGFAYAGIGKT